jgi:hypothetical protein
MAAALAAVSLCFADGDVKGEKPLKGLMVGNSSSICNLGEMPNVAEPDAAHAATTRRHTGIPSIAVARNGRLWVTFYGSPTGGEDSNNYCTLATSADGTIPTYFDSRKGSDWVNCMVYVADRLEALDDELQRCVEVGRPLRRAVRDSGGRAPRG